MIISYSFSKICGILKRAMILAIRGEDKMKDPKDNIEENAERIDQKERESIHKSFQGEKSKLSQMSWGERVQYIWEYYKIPIISVMIVAIVLVSLIRHYATLKDDVLFGIIVNANATGATLVSSDLDAYLALGEKERTFLENGLWLNSSATFEAETKITCYVAAHDLDYFLGDAEAMNHFAKQGLISDLEKILPEALYTYFQDRIVSCDTTDAESGELYEQSYLRLDGTRFAELLSAEMRTGAKLYLGSCVVAPNEDNVRKLVQYIYDLETGAREMPK